MDDRMAAREQAWNAIEAIPARALTALFEQEPDRLSRLTIEEAGLHFDFSKTHLDQPTVAAFVALAEAAGFARHRDALFAGAVVNVTEGRAAEHGAERGEGAPESVARARGLHARMRSLIDAIEAGGAGAGAPRAAHRHRADRRWARSC